MRISTIRSGAVATLIGVLLLAACGGTKAAEPPAGASTAPVLTSGEVTPIPPTPTPIPAFPPSTEPVVGPPASGGAILLKSVRMGDERGYDRFVIEFDGKSMPAYWVGYGTTPAVCPAAPSYTSAGPVSAPTVTGATVLNITLKPATGHGSAGKLTYPTQIDLPYLTAIQHSTQTCDSNGTVIWALGLPAKLGFRVSTVGNPPRLVVDVLQP